jgi:hypothetical protein
VWHLDCQAGGDIDLTETGVKVKDHDFIASIERKDGRLELFIPPSYTKAFDSNEALNDYLEALGLEEISLPESIKT